MFTPFASLFIYTLDSLLMVTKIKRDTCYLQTCFVLMDTQLILGAKRDEFSLKKRLHDGA